MAQILKKSGIEKRIIIIGCFYFFLIYSTNYVNCTKHKRQLYREQLLPEKGGKIPESAFHPERLILNRLNQQGISVPDGISLDQRRQEKHPFPKQPLPETLQVVLMDDGRYVAPPGRYQYTKQPTIDTTYVIRMPLKLFNDFAELHNLGKTHVDISKWKPPNWMNDISKTIWKNNQNLGDYINAAQILEEYSSFLQKIHRDFDK